MMWLFPSSPSKGAAVIFTEVDDDFSAEEETSMVGVFLMDQIHTTHKTES